MLEFIIFVLIIIICGMMLFQSLTVFKNPYCLVFLPYHSIRLFCLSGLTVRRDFCQLQGTFKQCLFYLSAAELKADTNYFSHVHTLQADAEERHNTKNLAVQELAKNITSESIIILLSIYQ